MHSSATKAAGNEDQRFKSLAVLYKTILELINTGTPLATVLEKLCQILEERFPGLLCSVLLLDADGVTLRHGAAPSLPAIYNQYVDGLRIGPSVGSCGTAAFRGEPVIVTDIATDALWKEAAAMALPHGLRACWSTPIFSTTSKVLGTFAVYYKECRAPLPEHRDMVECVTHLAGLAIERDRADASLQAVQNRYRALVENLPAITYIAEVGVLGPWLYVSPQIKNMLGFSPEEWLANSANWINHIHPDDREHALAAETLFWERGGIYSAEYRMIAKDDRILWFRDTATYLKDAQKERPMMQGVLYDITEHKHLEEQLQHSQKMEAVGKLAGGVAHDFNNLLMIIQGHTERVMREVSEHGTAHKETIAIQEAVRRASSLTAQLLAFGRKQVLQPHLADLNVVVAEVGHMLQRVIGKNIELQLITTSSPCAVLLDQTQMEQAVLNLAVNARDAMPQGGKLIIETRKEEIVERPSEDRFLRPGKYVVLTVTDNGTGMDAQTQSRIFEPFFTTKAPGKGTGLGLASVYGTVKQSGGWITFRSKLGHGTTFQIYLPEARGENEPLVAGIAATAATKGTETILLVEDEDEIRDMSSEYLQHQGYTVLCSRNGKEALEIAGRYKGLIDLLVTDLIMPELGGRELADSLKKLRPRTKLLFTSGFPEHSVSANIQAALLQKPYPLTELACKIREVLDTPEFRLIGARSASQSCSQ